MAQSIDDAGTVGGSLGDGGTPYVWNASGKGHALKVPSGYHGGRVFSVNGDWAVGWVGVGKQGQVVAARWNLRTGAANVYSDQEEALAVDARGEFAGGMENGYLFRGGRFVALPGVVDSYGAMSDAEIVGMAGDGKTVVGNASASKSYYNVIWHC